MTGPIGESFDRATAAYDSVLQQVGPPPGWMPTAAPEADRALDAALDDIAYVREQFSLPLGSLEIGAAMRALDSVEQYLRSLQ